MTPPKSRKYLDMWKYSSMSIINILSLKWLLKLWSSVNYFFSPFVRPPVMFSIMPVKVTSRWKNKVLKLKLHTLDILKRSDPLMTLQDDFSQILITDCRHHSNIWQIDWLTINITVKHIHFSIDISLLQRKRNSKAPKQIINYLDFDIILLCTISALSLPKA